MSNSNSSLLFRLTSRLSTQDKINFARHLALVVKAGLPIFEGLGIIKEQTPSRVLRHVIDQLLIDVNNGRFLADSLDRFEYLFGNFFISIIRVGESSGTLAANLLFLAEELQKSKELSNKVRSAMIYPIVILIATLGVSGFLTFVVFPKLLPIFSNLGAKLPPTTQIMINALQFLQTYFIHLIIGIAILIVGTRMLIKKVMPVRYVAHRTILAVPVLLNLSISINMANFTRILGLLLKSGVKILEAAAITSSTFDNLFYKRALLAARDEIQRGGQLATYLTQKKPFFPPLVSGMVRLGENTGNLEENLEYLSEYYTEEVDMRLHALTSVIEPVMLLIMGFLVGFVALSIITPIYSISQNIK